MGSGGSNVNNELVLDNYITDLFKAIQDFLSKLSSFLSVSASAFTTLPALHKNNGYLK